MAAEYSDAKRNLLEKYLRGELGSLRTTPAIPRRNPEQTIPLSYAQEQVWLHAQLAPEFPLYNEPVTIHYSGQLNVAALEKSFNEILCRHEAWRTCFTVVDGQPVQEVQPHLSISLPVLDLLGLPKEQREAAALRVATEDASKPLDLTQVPLFRVRLVRLEDQEYRLYLTLSHIIFDGVAIYRVLLPELSTLYKAYSCGQPSPLPELSIQYPDYACWQRQCMTREVLAKDVEFWRQRLSGSLPEIYLPTDRPHERSQTFRGSMYPFKLNSTLTTALRSFGLTEGVSLFHVLLAGFAALLYRYSGEERIPIGSVTAGRNQPETQALLGYFLNTVVLAADLSGDPSFREMVKRTRNLTIDALEHDRLPFEHLVRELKVQRDPGRNPFFQALFSLEPPLPEIDPAWRLTQMDVDTGASKYDLSLELDERREEVLARFHYSTDLFDPATIVRMGAHWQSLLEATVANPEQPISEHSLLTTDEQHQMVEWNKTDADLPEEQILHKYFEHQVERTPEAAAVRFEDKHLTYHELDRQANEVAHYLQSLGVGPEVAVALYLERSIEMVVGILGVLKAGGACLPLDPAHPADRLAFMLEETQAPVLLTLSRLQSQVPSHQPRILCLDSLTTLCTDKVESLPPRQVRGDDTAYIIYTSGSTGQPKGVRVLHRGLVNSTLARTLFYPEAVQTFLLLSSFSFDSSLAGIFWTLSVGGTLVLPPDPSRWELDSLSSLVEQHQVSHLLCVPSLYQTLIESSPIERLASLKVAIVAGESCAVALVKQHHRRLPHAALYNEYGPTEATVWCSAYRCEPQAEAIRVPIGRPIANTQLYVLDSHRQMVPVGVPGELYVGGAGVAGGYWKRPELTAEKFVSNPFSPTPGARLYKTGDLVRFLPDGNLEYLGRVDHQVKLRGFRIELGEIEAALASHPAVQAAVVVAREDVPGEKRLVAYYTASDGKAKATGVAELRAHLSGKLPDYMVPAAYVWIERMPLTANGKLDRKALPMPQGDAYAVPGYEAPQGETETRLAEIWADVLKIDRVGRNDNFFELGGHSLLAVRLIERMRQQGLRASVRTLFMTPTLAGLSAAADKGANLEVPENRIPLGCEVITPQMLPLLTLSQEEIDGIVNRVPGGAANVQDIYPLAPLQEGILFHHLLGGEGDPYLLGGLLSFDTRRRLDAYVEAMQKVIDRHDILRTAVVWEGLREPVQVVQRKADLSVEEVKLDAAGGDAEQRLYALFDPRHHRIDVRQAPLLRVYVAYDEPQERWLMVELLHHLAGDHVTLEVIQEEVQAHLLQQAHTLPTPQPFRNLVAQSRLGMSPAEHQAYFQKLLGDVEEPTAPFGLLDVQGDGTGIEEARTALDSVLAGRIRERARRLGVSAASLCHLAWAQVLARVSGRDDVVFGTVLFGRMQGGQGADRVMGLFINTLPVRIQIGEEGVETSVRRVHAQLADLLEHEHASLALAQRCSGVAAPTPLFSALLNYRHTGDAARSGSAETQRAWEGIKVLRREERTSYPFTLSVDDLAEEFALTAQTTASVGAKRVCEYMRMALEGLIEALEKEPGRAVRTLDVLPAAEREQVLFKFNDTAVEYPREKCIHELFEEQVEKSPGNTAVVFEDTSLTYAELNGRANQLARHLRKRGVGPEVLVGMALERSLELVVGVLGILKAGGGYVPLDPENPKERLGYMLKDSAVKLVVTEERLMGRLPEHGVEVVSVDGNAEKIAEESAENPEIEARGENLAYMIYTSGSTGKPKGAMNEHGGLRNRLLWMQQTMGLAEGDVVMQKTPYSFDVSVWELLWPLVVGARLVVARPGGHRDSRYLMELIERKEITTLHFVPSMMQAFLQEEGLEPKCGSVRRVICSGEALGYDLQERFFNRLGKAKLYNLYGPTEAGIDVTWWECERGSKRAIVPIGRPVANTKIYLLDKNEEPAPVGVAGELHIAGVQVGRGYWKRPELTAERFIANRFGTGRLYKTGDLARYLEDGAIEFLGRNDHQVKLRGFRIELGEIEAALASHPAVQAAVVVAREDVPGEKRLVAYYTASDGKAKATGVAELRAHLSGKLPDYMVPAAYVWIERMPLTANGKLDRKALPMPQGDAYAVPGYEAPQGETETRLAEIWADVLKIDRVGRNDNFFELGGHSLLAVRLIERMRQQGLRASVRTLFMTPTLAGLSAAADKGANLEVPENRIPLGCEVITPQMLPLLTLSQEEIDGIVNRVPGGAANVQDIYPLAPLQEGILFHHLLGGEGDPYLLGGLLSFDTRRRLDAYVEAMQKVIDRHDILRTAVVWEGLREPVQVVQRKADLSVEEVKLDAAGGDAEQRLYALFDPRHHRIDVRQAPLLRVYVAYDEPQERWLMVELLHHLAGDHVTLEVIQEEVQAHLLQQAHTLPTPQPFRNLVAQSRLGMSPAEHQAYFQKLLGDVEEPTAPFGLLDVQGDGTGIEEARTALDSVLAGRIRERARRLGVSAASLCHLAWAQVLARVSGRDDVVFGTVLFGRMQGGQGADRVMGLFINTLPVRIQIGEEGVETSVRRVHAQLADLLEHEHASLALAQRCSGVAAPTPLFSALLNYRHTGDAARSGSAETQRAWEGIKVLRREERTSYPFTLSVDDLAEEFALTAQTTASVGAKRVCEYMRMALEGLIEALEKEPGRAVRTLDVLPAAEREQVLFKFNDTAVEYPREKCIHELFEEQVEKSPGNTAVVFEDTSLTYAELNGRANQLACYLRELGVRPDTCVGICVERGLEMTIGLLAILKAGGTYVPLDPRHPVGRLRDMLEDSAPAGLLTQGQVKGLFSGLGPALPVLDLADATASWRSKPTTNLDRVSVGITPEHPAYVIYTSGSTGQPKGVRVLHRGLVNSTLARTLFYPEAVQTFLLLSSFSFDSSLAGIFWTLSVGGTLVLPPDPSRWELDSLSSLVEQHQVSHLLCVPSLYQTLIESSPIERLASLKVAIVAGESCAVALVKQHHRRLPHAALYNEYGPTEATVWCSAYRCEPQAEAIRVPIGRPIANTQLYVLDSHRQMVPVGVPGELYVGGAGVAGGYWKRPELTAEKFVSNPFSPTPGARLYKTGDLVRFLPDGNLEYLGRVDHQVKLRGFRIELGEIEAALASHPAVQAAVVVAREDVPGEKRLVAYYTASDGKAKATGVAELRAHLSGKLPDYMVPAAYVWIERMPLTANGKLDRKALPMPQGDAYAVPGYEAPQGETETRLAEIWADVLKIDRVGRNDNFFELGGHSLLAMQVMARIRHIFNLELPVRSIFDEPTIAGLAGELPKAQALGIKARARIAQIRVGSAASSPSRQALLAQLDNLSATELQNLLQHVLDDEHPA